MAEPCEREDDVSKAFASQAKLAEKKISFERLAYAYTAAGDPHRGNIIGDAQAMPVTAQEVMDIWKL